MEFGKFPASGFLSNLVETRRFSCDSFLKGRDTDRARLAETARKSFGQEARVLITSSPVHRLANSTSDIDLICVAESDELGLAQAAQQMYDGTNHLESIGFLDEDLSEAFTELAQWSRLSLGEGAERFLNSQSNATIRSKYLERIINGIDAESGTSPYIEHLLHLSVVWAAVGVRRAVKLATMSQMAVYAGWSRAAHALAVEALLQSMDATLSAHGWVCSNSKWFLPRWRRALAEFGVGATSEEWPSWIDASWDKVRAAEQNGHLLAAIMSELIENASSFFGVELFAQWTWQVDDNVVGVREPGGLEGSINTERKRAIDLAPPKLSKLDLSEVSSLVTDQAVRWLHLGRSGFASFRLVGSGEAQ
ncbi:DUF6001 family protein [Erythrobacter sp.]|uniref:DUF6001 family protein n=1 Tax=Erythrobacter sp. TaxID=1042 RepID=UPI003C7765ED